MIRTPPIDADSEHRRMVNPRKVYPVDPGLIPVFDRTPRGQRRSRPGDRRSPGTGTTRERRRHTCEPERALESISSHTFPIAHEHLVQVCADLDCARY